MMSEANAYYQSLLQQEHGLLVPQTSVISTESTNDDATTSNTPWGLTLSNYARDISATGFVLW